MYTVKTQTILVSKYTDPGVVLTLKKHPSMTGNECKYGPQVCYGRCLSKGYVQVTLSEDVDTPSSLLVSSFLILWGKT